MESDFEALRYLAIFILGVGFLFIIFVIVMYVAQSIFLNKFHQLVRGKKTALAWIPICNIYLLGSLTINKIAGWILVACLFLTGIYSLTINGVKTTYSILPPNVGKIVSSLYDIVIFALFIYAIFKYFKIKNVASTTDSKGVESISQNDSQAEQSQDYSDNRIDDKK